MKCRILEKSDPKQYGAALRILTSKSSYVLAGRFPSHKVGHGILPVLGKSNIYMGKKAAKTSDQETATLLWHGVLLCITSDQVPAKIMAMQLPGKSRRFSLQFGYLSGWLIICTLQWTPAFAVLHDYCNCMSTLYSL